MSEETIRNTDLLAYSSWTHMKNRCNNPNNDNYHHYGGRGIKVCDRWLESFQNFFDDMGDRPSKKYSLERINNDGDYTPENCVWATVRKQTTNQRRNNNGMPTGVRTSGKYFRSTIETDTKKQNLGSYKTSEDAAIAYDNACEDLGEGRPNNTVRNSKPLCRNYSIDNGYPKGVQLLKEKNKFRSIISKNGNRYHIGYFATPEEAAKAYDDKAEELGLGRPNKTINITKEKQQ